MAYTGWFPGRAAKAHCKEIPLLAAQIGSSRPGAKDDLLCNSNQQVTLATNS